MKPTTKTICVLVMTFTLLAFTACSNSEMQNSSKTEPQTTAPGATESVTEAEATASVEVSEAPSSESVPTESDEADKRRTAFNLYYFGETEGDAMAVSLALPEGWTSGSGGIFDENGDWIANMELLPMESEQPFADLDVQNLNTAAIETTTKELTVSGYPAKLYTLRFEPLGNGDRETSMQYLYYVLVDDIPHLYIEKGEGFPYIEDVYAMITEYVKPSPEVDIIAEILGTGYTMGEEQTLSLENRVIRWKQLALDTALPYSFEPTEVGDAFGTDKGDALYIEDTDVSGSYLLIDVGDGDTIGSPGYRLYSWIPLD